MKMITVMGIEIPAFSMCKRCGKLTSKFDKFAYSQPCDTCKNTKEYEEEIARDKQEKKKRAHINDALKGRLPVAVHEYRGRYLYTNHKGDVIKDEKVHPMQPGEIYKK